MTLTDMLYGILFNPVVTLQALSRDKPLAKGLAIFIGVLIFNLIIGGANQIAELGGTLGFSTSLVWITGLVTAIFSLIMLFLMAGLFSLLGEIVYNKGNGKGLLVCFCLAVIPGVFGPPLQYLSGLIGLNWLGVLLSVIIFLWMVVLQVMALREALSLQTSQAILIYILPLVAAGILVFVLAGAALLTIPWPSY